MRGEERKRKRISEYESREGYALTFKAYGHSLSMVYSSVYLGKTLTTVDNEWPDVITNLRK